MKYGLTILFLLFVLPSCKEDLVSGEFEKSTYITLSEARKEYFSACKQYETLSDLHGESTIRKCTLNASSHFPIDDHDIYSREESFAAFRNEYLGQMGFCEESLFNDLDTHQQQAYLINIFAASTFLPVSFTDTILPGKLAALRQVWLSALNTLYLGAELSQALGIAHEFFTSKPDLLKTMTFHNSGQGRVALLKLFQSAAKHNRLIHKEEMQQMALSLLKTGHLRYIRNGRLVSSDQ